MFADDKWSRCNTKGFRGIYIWTAGQWENPKTKSTFVWKLTDDHKKPGSPEFRNQAMGYTNWYKPWGEPNNYGGHEACVNLWPKYDYTWNDEPCKMKYCFICEDHTVSLWSPDWVDLHQSQQRCIWVVRPLNYEICMCQYNLNCNWLWVLVLVLCKRNKTVTSDFLAEKSTKLTFYPERLKADIYANIIWQCEHWIKTSRFR